MASGFYNLYVSPSLGRDTWSGSVPGPNANRSDGPFASLTRARDAVREMIAQGALAHHVRVLLRGETYFLDETLEFTPADAGTAEYPITYGAFPGEQPIISGGRLLTDWTVGEVHGQACWMAELPAVAAGDWYFTQLFVNGVRRPRTRRPREGFFRFSGLPEGRRGFWHRAPSAYVAPGELDAGWRNRGDVEIVALQHWFDSHLRIADYQELDEGGGLVTFLTPSLSDLGDEAGQMARYYVENVFEALEQPGEWYLDRAEGVLYYLPLPGEDPEETEVIAPRLDCLVRFAGTADGGKVRHLRLEHLDFRHAEWRLPPANAGAVQAAFTVPGAIVLRGAEECVLYGCRVSHISQYAIEVQRGSTRNRILACALFDLGAGGVKINHEGPLRTGTPEAPAITGTDAFAGMDYQSMGWGDDGPAAEPMRTEVADCVIHDGGRLYHSGIGVWIGDSGDNYVHHNHIYNLYYTGISAGWTWGYAPTRTARNRIEYNHLHHLGQGLLSDMGAIYLLGLQPGSTVRGNLVHDVSSYGYGGWGIYTDEGCSYLRIENNLVYRTKSGGFHQHYGRDNVVRNNVFALAREDQVIRSRAEAVQSFIFTGNLIYCREGDALGGNWSNPNVIMTKNLYWRGGRPLTFSGLSLEDWQALGFDREGLVADPLFSDPDAGDFTVREDSTAFEVGYAPLSLHEVGPRFHGVRPFAGGELPEDDVEAPGPLVQSRLQLLQPGLADAAAGGREPERLAIPAGEPARVALTAENYGRAPAEGTIRLVVSPEGAGTLTGPTTLAYALPPGAKATLTTEVLLHPASPHLFVETLPSDETVIPNALLLLRQ